jgi:serine phosphatase RsbU (regulator of sigma subunit)
MAVVFSDGLLHAGERSARPIDLPRLILDLAAASPLDSAVWADRLLAEALGLEDGRPGDDITVLVAAILEGAGEDVRRLTVRMPF